MKPRWQRWTLQLQSGLTSKAVPTTPPGRRCILIARIEYENTLCKEAQKLASKSSKGEHRRGALEERGGLEPTKLSYSLKWAAQAPAWKQAVAQTEDCLLATRPGS